MLASEQEVHVPPSTEGQPTSQPSAASLLVLNLLGEQAAIEVQVDALEVAAVDYLRFLNRDKSNVVGPSSDIMLPAVVLMPDPAQTEEEGW